MIYNLTFETTEAQDEGLSARLAFVNRQRAGFKQAPWTVEDFLLAQLAVLAQALAQPLLQKRGQVLVAALARAPKEVQDSVKQQLGLATAAGPDPNPKS